MNYIKNIILYSLIGFIIGIIIFWLVAFVKWDISNIDQIFIPARIGAALGFLFGNVSYLCRKDYL